MGEESRLLAKIAHDNAVNHMRYASDMLNLAIGEKPELIHDPLGEFAKIMARLLS